jgi:hypothetical protein
MSTKHVVEMRTPSTNGAFESSGDDDDSAITERGVLNERLYAWQILLEAIEQQTSTSDAGRLQGRDRVVALIREADEGGLAAIDLMVELADQAAALAMRVHDDPFAALVHVQREMLAVWRERA